MFFVQATMPGLANWLVFVPSMALYRPWSIVTYMFLHGGLMHILFNMLGLYFFGPAVETRLGSQRFTWLYFISGISGAIASFFFAAHAPIIGASAGVFGVMLGFAWFWPDTPILIWGIIPVPARILVIITTIMSLYFGVTGAQSGVAHFAHLGGYAGAYLYLRRFERVRLAFKRRAKTAPVEATKKLEAWKSIDVAKIHEVNRDQVNRILDKISAKGIGSLTPEERIFLSNFVPMDDRTGTVQ